MQHRYKYGTYGKYRTYYLRIELRNVSVHYPVRNRKGCFLSMSDNLAKRQFVYLEFFT